MEIIVKTKWIFNTAFYKNEPRLNGVYYRNNLPRIKDEIYITNLHEYFDIGTHWVAFYLQ